MGRRRGGEEKGSRAGIRCDGRGSEGCRENVEWGNKERGVLTGEVRSGKVYEEEVREAKVEVWAWEVGNVGV